MSASILPLPDPDQRRAAVAATVREQFAVEPPRDTLRDLLMETGEELGRRKQQVRELRRFLLRYSQHLDFCAMHRSTLPLRCSCGLQAALDYGRDVDLPAVPR